MKYQTKLCQTMCMHDVVLVECNCSMTQLADFRHPGALAPLCKDLGNDEACLERLAPTLKNRQAECVCPSECDEVHYDTQATMSRWPAKQYWPQLSDK